MRGAQACSARRTRAASPARKFGGERSAVVWQRAAVRLERGERLRGTVAAIGGSGALDRGGRECAASSQHHSRPAIAELSRRAARARARAPKGRAASGGRRRRRGERCDAARTGAKSSSGDDRRRRLARSVELRRGRLPRERRCRAIAAPSASRACSRRCDGERRLPAPASSVPAPTSSCSRGRAVDLARCRARRLRRARRGVEPPGDAAAALVGAATHLKRTRAPVQASSQALRSGAAARATRGVGARRELRIERAHVGGGEQPGEPARRSGATPPASARPDLERRARRERLEAAGTCAAASPAACGAPAAAADPDSACRDSGSRDRPASAPSIARERGGESVAPRRRALVERPLAGQRNTAAPRPALRPRQRSPALAVAAAVAPQQLHQTRAGWRGRWRRRSHSARRRRARPATP